jgi:metal-responsive CopG/Arc/MetJ family transcriptional regulator
MSKTSKVAISLPTKIFEAIEQERKESGESRSELFRQAIEILLHRRQEEEKLRQYILGYQQMPETKEEITAAEPW